ncbi:hypothetical protein AKJ16_DCAP11799 [Drosera capensis]
MRGEKGKKKRRKEEEERNKFCGVVQPPYRTTKEQPIVELFNHIAASVLIHYSNLSSEARFEFLKETKKRKKIG